MILSFFFFFFQAEDGIRDADVTRVQTCALPIYRDCGPAHSPDRTVWEGMTMSLAVAKKAAITSTGPSAWRPAVVALAILLVLAMLPSLVDPYQTVLLTYGLIMAIAALGFNLLLGYTGLLSFGHSAYFGAGAYTVAFIVRDLGVN